VGGGMRRIVFWALLVLLCAGTLALGFNVRLVHAQDETVYINFDGSVSPSSAPLSTVDKVTYTFTGNISYPTYYGIVVERSNIVIDGNGYTLQGFNQSGTGLSNQMSNVTIENTNIKSFSDGIYLDGSSNNTVSDNDVTANGGNGILLVDSSNDTISGNTATANYGGIWLDYFSNNNIVSGNSATGNSAYGIDLQDSSSYNTVSGNTATASSYGIYLDGSSNNTVSDNNATANYGIYLDSSSNNTVSGNTATASSYGIYLDGSSYNTFSGNDATANSDSGIYIYSSFNCTVSGNNVSANTHDGIYLGSSYDNTVSGNNVRANSQDGIYLENSSNNIIYHNNFVGNSAQAYADAASLGNAWDNGYPSGGNYWSDYGTRYPNATEIDSSGIWNTPYNITANNTDYYPLMNQVTVIPEFQPFMLLPLFMIITLLVAIGSKKKRNARPRTGINKIIV
jgi:parallel beta-helix repeat protein